MVIGIKYISLFSGIEAASVAWEPLGWEPLCFCEIEEFPSAVLAHRWPNVPNLGDITKVDWGKVIEKHGRPDVIVGGSPCQSFSVAGGRESLDGESRLMFEYIRAVDEVRPAWLLWENVPGVLNTRDNAFVQLLDSLSELRYGLAWRVLDAQFFGVAQRRRRVFLVGRLGAGGGPPSAVLFESQSVRGNTQTGREKREELARAARERAREGGSAGFKYHQGSGARTLGYEDENSPTITADYHNPAVLTPWDVQSKRVYSQDGTAPTLQSGMREGGGIQPIVMMTANTSANGSNVSEDGVAYTLDRTNSNAVAFVQNTRDEVRLQGGDGSVVGALCADAGAKQQTYVMASAATNAEIGVGGGVPDADGAQLARAADTLPRAMTSNNRDVFPSLCAADGSKRFIDNQSVDGGRLVIERTE